MGGGGTDEEGGVCIVGSRWTDQQCEFHHPAQDRVPPMRWALCWALDTEDVLTVHEERDSCGIWPGWGGRRGANVYQVMYFMSSFTYVILCDILSDAPRLVVEDRLSLRQVLIEKSEMTHEPGGLEGFLCPWRLAGAT